MVMDRRRMRLVIEVLEMERNMRKHYPENVSANVLNWKVNLTDTLR